PTQVTKQDGSVTRLDYKAGNCTVATDEAGNMRRSCTDGIGRLIEVDEPTLAAIPNQNDYVTLQSSGNFVLFDVHNKALWSTGTSGSSNGPLEVQDDGNVVLYQFKWQAGTYRAWNGGSVPFDSCRISDRLFAGQTLQQNQCLENLSSTTFASMDNGNLL